MNRLITQPEPAVYCWYTYCPQDYRDARRNEGRSRDGRIDDQPGRERISHQSQIAQRLGTQRSDTGPQGTVRYGLSILVGSSGRNRKVSEKRKETRQTSKE